MAITLVQSQISTVDNTPSVAFATPNTAGNCLVIATRYGADSGTVSDSQGNAYTQVLNDAQTGVYTKCWFAPNCIGGANTVILSNKAAVWILLEYSGVQSATPLDTATNSQGSFGPIPLSIATTVASDLLVLVGANSGATPTQTGSYTARQGGGGTYGGTQHTLAAWDTIAGSAGSFSNTINVPGLRGIGCLFALKAAAAASISVSPSSAAQAASATLTVTGTGTHFVSGTTTVSFSGTGITVGTITVASAASLTAVITIAPTAATGARTVTVTTGSEAPAASFTVTAGVFQRGNIDYDQIRSAARQGTGAKFQMMTGSTVTAGHMAAYDANGNVVDGGAPSTGTVTSTALTVPTEFTVAGSPVTTNGTFAVTKASETANTVWAAPNGAAGVPTFRALLMADLPSGVGTGTVTSVGLSLPAEFVVSGSPVTASGTLTGTKANQSANQVYAGPSSGAAAVPAFRALAATDLPAGTGTVTSVALAAPAEFTVSGSPVTGSGTLTLTKASQAANTYYAGPSSGAAAQPAFRTLVAADIPQVIKVNGTAVGV